MTELRWIVKNGEKILQYRSQGRTASESTSGIIGTFYRNYDTGWVGVPTIDEPDLQRREEEEK